MAVALESYSFAEDSPAPQDVALPSGIVAGDYLVAVIGKHSDIQFDTDAETGWTSRIKEEFDNAGIGMSVEVFTRLADGTEPATLSWGYAESQLSVFMARFSGVDTLDPWIDAVGSSGHTTSAISTELTVDVAGSMLVLASKWRSAIPSGEPAGMTLVLPTVDAAVLLPWTETRSAGATGTRTVSYGSATDWCSVLFALRSSAAFVQAPPARTLSMGAHAPDTIQF